MLGQPISMLLPQVLGFRLDGELPEGATATDLVLTVTEMLRERGVVGKFVEFFGPGPAHARARRPGDDREHVARVRLDLRDLPRRPRDTALPRVHGPARPSRSSWSTPTPASRACSTPPDSEDPTFSDTLALDLSSVEPSIAGPKRPQDRIALADAKSAYLASLKEHDAGAAEALGNQHDAAIAASFPASDPPADEHDGEAGKPRRAHGAAVAERQANPVAVTLDDGTEVTLDHGRVVIAAITSCTNTSNPSVMLGAGLVARKAIERGLTSKPWVKTSLAPGSTVVTDYLQQAGLDAYLDAARLQPGRLRLHDLHRQLRAAAGGDLEGGDRERPGGLLGALGQSQLRGPDPAGRPQQLPGVAAAVRRLRARRADGHRPAQRPARRGVRRRGRLPARHLADLRRDQADGRRGGALGHVHAQLRRRLHRRRALARARHARRRPLHLAGLDLCPPPLVLRGDGSGAGPGRADRRARGCSPCSATRSPPTTSPRPARSSAAAPPASG